MNAHSVGPRLSSSQPLAQLGRQLRIERLAHPGVDDLHHLGARQARRDRVDVHVQMRRGDAELEDDGALGAGRREQRALRAVIFEREVRELVDGQPGDVLDVLLPDDHGVPAHGPVAVQHDPEAVVLRQDLTRFADVGAEDAGHGCPHQQPYNRHRMRTIRLGRTNTQVSAVSLGTWGHGGPNVSDGASVGWSGHDDRLAREALIEAHRRGIRHWDTADAYGAGHAETLIGEVFAAGDVPRGDIFLASKFGWVKGPHDHFYDAGFMRAQCEQSLRNLRTDVIDLYYFHHCDFGPGDKYFDGAPEVMRRLREEGKIRFVGLSDWDASKIMR